MRRNGRMAWIVALALSPLVAAACGGGSNTDASGADSEATVTVRTFAFRPDPLEVAAGTTVTFVNRDEIDHTATAGTREEPMPDRFDGSLPEQGATFEVTLDEPGDYPYFCRIHPGPGMTGTITVQ